MNEWSFGNRVRESFMDFTGYSVLISQVTSSDAKAIVKGCWLRKLDVILLITCQYGIAVLLLVLFFGIWISVCTLEYREQALCLFVALCYWGRSCKCLPRCMGQTPKWLQRIACSRDLTIWFDDYWLCFSTWKREGVFLIITLVIVTVLCHLPEVKAVIVSSFCRDQRPQI